MDRMLAMKLHARRGTDLKDIEQLVKFSKVGSGKEAKQLAEQHFPHSEVPADAVRKVDDAITKARMQGPPSGPSARGAPTETAQAVAARMADELQERRETQGSRGLTESKGQPQTNQSTAAQDARSKAPKGQRPMRSGQDANIPAAPTRPEPPKTENSPGTRKRGR